MHVQCNFFDGVASVVQEMCDFVDNALSSFSELVIDSEKLFESSIFDQKQRFLVGFLRWLVGQDLEHLLNRVVRFQALFREDTNFKLRLLQLLRGSVFVMRKLPQVMVRLLAELQLRFQIVDLLLQYLATLAEMLKVF